MAHEPADGAFDDRAAEQHLETAAGFGGFDHFDLHFLPQRPNPGGEVHPGVTAIGPEDPQSREPPQHARQQGLCARPFRRPGRGDLDPEQPAQGVNQRVALEPLNPLGGGVADRPTVCIRLHALDCPRWRPWAVPAVRSGPAPRRGTGR